jgi:hypothetical protein
LVVKLPNDRFQLAFEPVTPELLPLFPQPEGSPAALTLIRLSLVGDAQAEVDGFGMPFYCADEEVNRWVNEYKPVLDNFGLLDFFSQKVFQAVVSTPISALKSKFGSVTSLPKFEYPFGNNFSWDIPRLKAVLAKAKLKNQFEAAHL